MPTTARTGSGDKERTGSITISTEPVDHHTAIAYACNLLDTAPWIVQDDVPLEDVHGWVATIRDHVAALAAEHAALAVRCERLQHALEREVRRSRSMRGFVPLTRRQIEERCRLAPGDMDAPGPRPGGAETGGR